MPAGFALVQRGSRLTGAPDVWDMAEFFVVRRHRKRGVGAEAALRVFAAHRGRWEVRQRRENPAATAFWLRTIARFTHAFTDDELDDAAFRGRVQRFVSGA
jgi:predicted acetyltransferase